MTNDHGAIEERLESLERQNRRMKLAGLAGLVIAGAVVLTGLAGSAGGQAGKAANIIRATGFVLVDAQGRTRAALDMNLNTPELVLYDANGKKRAALFESPDGPALILTGVHTGEEGVLLQVSADGPLFSLADAQKFTTQVGVTGLVTPATGETHKTPAASIVMFGNDKEHHVLWSAPPQH